MSMNGDALDGVLHIVEELSMKLGKNENGRGERKCTDRRNAFFYQNVANVLAKK